MGEGDDEHKGRVSTSETVVWFECCCCCCCFYLKENKAGLLFRGIM